MRGMLPMGAQDEYRDPSGTVALAEVHVGPAWIGKLVSSLEQASGARVAFITRYGDALLPSSESVVQEGDLVHAVYSSKNRLSVESVFEIGPEDI